MGWYLLAACFLSAAWAAAHPQHQDATVLSPAAKSVAPHYIDPRTCAGCHRAIAEQYRLTGMGRSLYRLGTATQIEDFTLNNLFRHTSSDKFYKMVSHDGRFFETRYELGPDGKQDNLVEEQIDYVIGSGNQARSYLHRTPEGKFVELPVSWYSQGEGHWGMTPGYDRPDQRDFHGTISYECLFCHDAYPPSDGRGQIRGEGDAVINGPLPEGIDCQRCHGPGSEHVAAAVSQRATPEMIRSRIINPARLSRNAQLEVCMECHLSTSGNQGSNALLRYDRDVFSYRPGEPLGDYKLYFDYPETEERKGGFGIVDAAYRLRMSACFRNSQITCLTCHDPHEDASGKAAESRYQEACEGCHRGVAHKLTLPTGQTCTSCHMPKRRGEYAVEIVLTDHYIQREKPRGDLLAPRVESDNPGPAGKLELYYPRELASQREQELYSAVVQAENGAQTQMSARRLQDAIVKYKPSGPGFYSALGRAYAGMGRNAEAIGWFNEALRHRPNDLQAMTELAAALFSVGRVQQGTKILEEAVRVAPQDSHTLTNLGNGYAREGYLGDARRTLLRALEVNPELAQAQNLLEQVELLQGNDARAEALFHEAVRFRPDLAEARCNLAKLLISKGNLDEAEFHLRRAILASPGDANAHHSYGLLLMLKQSYEQAIVELREAIRMEPREALAHSDLADILANLGREQEAANEYLRALHLKSDLPEAHLGLGLLLAGEGKAAEARPHLEDAAKDHDLSISQPAKNALIGMAKH